RGRARGRRLAGHDRGGARGPRAADRPGAGELRARVHGARADGGVMVVLEGLDRTTPAFFRYREVAGRVVITNFEGEYLLLTPDEFGAFSRGQVVPQSDLHNRLRERNFLRAEYQVGRAAERLPARKEILPTGPDPELLVVALRFHQTC